MKPTIQTFRTIEDLADVCYRWLSKKTEQQSTVTIALSGGRTPQALFEAFRNLDWSKVSVEKLLIFWGDERCVPPNDAESNFGNVKKSLIEYMGIPTQNIFRILGENTPELEAVRYAQVIENHLVTENGLPKFDLILLGLGDDGHTASIFPGNEQLFTHQKLCAVASHPISGQKRITLTGLLINNASEVVFLVTGSSKNSIIKEILSYQALNKYPACFVRPTSGNLTWLLDEAANPYM